MASLKKTLPCFACCLKRHRREIDALKDTVEHLKCELKSSSPATPQAAPSLSPVPTAPATVLQSLPRSTVSSQAVKGRERKFNIVLYGMDECPNGSPKSNRLEEDLKNALSVISEVDQSITSHSIRDIHRLGKYSVEARKSRPLLVKFICAADASSVLSKRRSSIGASVIIKPDMSPSERKRESILLKERWSFIQSGVPRKAIRIQGSRLLVRNKLHGQVSMSGSDLTFSCHNMVPVISNNAVNSVTLPIVSAPSPTASQPQNAASPTVLNESGGTATSPNQSPTHPPGSSPSTHSSPTPVSSQ